MRFWVSILLLLFPSRFRRRFGADLLATFEDRWRERAGLPLAVRTTGDLVCGAAIERLKGDGFMRTLWQDLRFGARTLVKSAGFSIIAIATLALGIGATTAIYSVVNAVLFKGLPYPNADRMVFIHESLPKAESVNVSWPDFVDWRAQNRVFAKMTAFRPGQINVSMPDGPKTARAAWVTSSFFGMLDARAITGRTFGESDDKPGALPAVVLSYRFWRNELNGDANVTGRQIDTADGPLAAAGVLAPDFRFEPFEFDLYVPVGLKSSTPAFVNRANHPGLQVIAEMREGVSLGQAREDMDAIMTRLGEAYPASNRDETAKLTPIADRLIGNVRTDLLMLFAAVLFVLLIGCANVAHLALARAARRQPEFAIRAAIGAGRWRLIRQVLAENALLCFGGGISGLLLAYWVTPLLTRMYPQAVPGLKTAHLDTNVFLFTLAVCAGTGMLFGFAPMLQAGRAGLSTQLRGGSARFGRRMRSFLFVAEIAIGIVVTVGAGLFVRSLAAVMNVDPGFRADHLLALDVARAKESRLPDTQFFEQAIARVTQLPGVESVSAVMGPPLGGTTWTSPFTLAGEKDVPETQRSWTALNMVTPGYFRTAGIQLLEGRAFDSTDTATSPRVAIVNQTMARRLWPQGGAIGKRIDVMYAAGRVLEVAGVIADVKQSGLEQPVMPEVYVPHSQMPVSFMTIMVRTSVDPGSLEKAATDAIHEVDKNQAVARVTPVMKTISALAARRRFAAVLLSLFSGLAVLLAAVGVSGVMAYSVAQRTREFGIRVAIGAQRHEVLRLVLKDGMLLTALGVAIGVFASWGIVNSIRTSLFGVQAHDALTFVASPTLLALVALLGCWLPARRAAHVDPIRTLRHD